MDKLADDTIREWNDLGAYYEFHDWLNQWRIFGSKKGLRNIAKMIEDFANSSNELSDHIHIGPYGYLKITLWNEPSITRDTWAGPKNYLLSLSRSILEKVVETNAGQVLNCKLMNKVLL